MSSAPVDPFDRRYKSPIASVLELRASARSSVVRAEALTSVQARSLVPTGLEDRILALAGGPERPALIVISGSAGGGKSAAINQLSGAADASFAGVLEDATHAEAPDQEQFERLVKFLAPLADGQRPYAGEPLLIAMNTGMAIRLFDQLNKHRGESHGFTALERELRTQLQLPPRDSGAELPGRIVVVNLDLRATTGGEDSLFRQILQALDPDDPEGIMDGAARCATCSVKAFCFVRTNAQIISSEPARSGLDAAAEELALERGRPLQPRELWDLATDLVTGGEPFGGGDPCDLIAGLRDDDAGPARVWRRLASNGAFVEPLSAPGTELCSLDPSFQPDDRVHDLLTQAGIDPADDAGVLQSFVGHGTGREAVGTAARLLEGAQLLDERGDYDRVTVGRGLVRAAALAGEVRLGAANADLFRAALGEYNADEDASAGVLEELRDLLGGAMASAFGVRVGVETFFLTRAYEARRTHAILVAADLRQEDDLLRLCHPDPVLEAAREGALVAGYRPLAINFELAGVALRIDLPLFRLLQITASGTKPSTADLERFFHLRRAAEALGRKAAADRDRPVLIADRDQDRRFRLARRKDVRGNPLLGVQEVA